MNRDCLRLKHIRVALQRIERYMAVGEDRYLADTLVPDATIRQLETIGEAARNVSVSTLALAPEIPWIDVIGPPKSDRSRVLRHPSGSRVGHRH